MRPFPVLVAAAALLAFPPGLAARQASPGNASYTLTATLDPVNSTIFGAGRLTWRNTSRNPATELRFHMYWNAWRDSSSTFLRERELGRTTPAPPQRTSADMGLIDLTTLAVAGPPSENLLPNARYIAPDDGNANDRTVLAVPLTRPVAPGETIAIDLGWNSHIPRTFARTGKLGSNFFIAQWFPKIGVLEDSGWNCHQFHSATEFFADYGAYDVSLTVPATWIVGATGREQSKTDSGGMTTHRYVQEDVHDFAWTTSPDYVDVRKRFTETGLPEVDMRLLLQPEHRAQADRYFSATEAALKFYGTWFGPYSYPQLTVVDPVTIFNAGVQGEGSAGMEYPTLITGGTNWVAPWSYPEPESVTVHEAGHQFWYGLVGSNEFEHAWLDEGINTYATARVMAERYPDRFVTVERYFGGFVPVRYADVPWTRDVDGNRLVNYRLAPAWDSHATPTYRGFPGNVRSITYAKTALALQSLERIIGWTSMQRVLATFFARGKFRHPTPEEFFATASETSGQDLTWFFDAVFKQPATFDYAVDKVTRQSTDSGSVDSTILVRRLSDGVFPVDVRTTFEDGASVTERWSGAERWRTFRYQRGSDVRTVEIDPDRVLTLDLNYTNNSWTAHPRATEAAEKWSLRWLTWLENVLLTYAFFA